MITGKCYRLSRPMPASISVSLHKKYNVVKKGHRIVQCVSNDETLEHFDKQCYTFYHDMNAWDVLSLANEPVKVTKFPFESLKMYEQQYPIRDEQLKSLYNQVVEYISVCQDDDVIQKLLYVMENLWKADNVHTQHDSECGKCCLIGSDSEAAAKADP